MTLLAIECVKKFELLENKFIHSFMVRFLKLTYTFINNSLPDIYYFLRIYILLICSRSISIFDKIFGVYVIYLYIFFEKISHK